MTDKCTYCESDNFVEKETETVFYKELYIYCDDCRFTSFYGWKYREKEE